MTVASVQYYTGNAFTSTPHGGGQAAILILPSTDARLHDEEFRRRQRATSTCR
jgi:predicted PhzF superfamily epimerase YddE/YHI9